MQGNFNGRQLLQIRHFHGLTQRELGEKVAVAHSLIAHYESGRRTPVDDVVEALAAVLKVGPEFFYRSDVATFSADHFNFRDQISASERLRKRVMSYANLFSRVVSQISAEVELPALNLPSTSSALVDDVDGVASLVRAHLGIHDQAPIGRMSRVLENAGIVTTPLRFSASEVEQVDALSGYADTGVVLVNVTKESTTRARFNMAHELAHGIYHREQLFQPLAEKEAQADRFAGAFLLPKQSFTRDFRISSGSGSLDGLLEMKLRWGASIQAILMRARHLGLIDAAEIRVLFRTLSRHGWRQHEPAEPTPESESPELFADAVREWDSEPAERLARELDWTPEMVSWITGLRPENQPSTLIDLSGVISLDQRRAAKAESGAS